MLDVEKSRKIRPNQGKFEVYSRKALARGWQVCTWLGQKRFCCFYVHLTDGRVATCAHARALALLVITSYTSNKLLASFYNGDFPENCLIAKLKAPPKFPAIR